MAEICKNGVSAVKVIYQTFEIVKLKCTGNIHIIFARYAIPDTAVEVTN